MTLYGVVTIGGFLIWLWKRYVKKNKQASVKEEIYDESWRTWLIGFIFLFIFINMVIVAEFT